MRCRLLISIVSVTVIAAGCGGDGGYSSGPVNSNPSTSTTVSVQNNVFTPSATTVGVGATVSWTWAQGAAEHNVTFDDGQKSATQSTGGYTRWRARLRPASDEHVRIMSVLPMLLLVLMGAAEPPPLLSSI